MMNDASSKILAELRAHPTEKVGFHKEDFDGLSDHQRSLLVEPFIERVENGNGTAVEPLQWLLRERYVIELAARLLHLPAGSPGLVFLPYWLYKATADRSYLHKMMQEIVKANPAAERRISAVGGYLRNLIGKEPLFWDFCRYLVLNDPSPEMKENALVWLAHEKGYPLIELDLDEELGRCLRGMIGSGAPTSEALAILDRLHSDTGLWKPIG